MAEMMHTPMVRIESSKAANDKNMVELHREALARAYSFLLSLPSPDQKETTLSDAPAHANIEGSSGGAQ